MKSSLVNTLCMLAIAGISFIFLINFLDLTNREVLGRQSFLAPQEVRGMDLFHKGKPYTLNFEQQNSVIEMLNRALPIVRIEPSELSPTTLEKLTIYRFNEDTISLIPLGLIDDNIIFKSTGDFTGNFLRDISLGRLKTLLDSSYDP
jgi:hypothetical protein